MFEVAGVYFGEEETYRIYKSIAVKHFLVFFKKKITIEIYLKI